MLSYRAFENILHSNLTQQKNFILLYIDLLDFKSVNHVYGHAVGDKVLQQIAARISNVIPNDDVVTRVQSDEFAVLLKGHQLLDEQNTLKQLLDDISQAIATEIVIDNQAIAVNAQIVWQNSQGKPYSVAALMAEVKAKLND
jgi:diguanylate cyclase (GGDEF)-like protein